MQTKRPPIVVIMGHVDHGKSTLLDYIRKSNIVGGEAGGITQHIGAYEVTHRSDEGTPELITFIDTPGHAAYQKMRERGALVADIAVLVVAADDGVKPQTKEALEAILSADIPYIVAINKIDKPAADIDRAKQSLAESGVMVEGYGGVIPCVEISAKSGKGVDELLNTILLVAELEELKKDDADCGKAIVIESHRDAKKGVAATIIIDTGTFTKGQWVVIDDHCSPIRTMEDHMGSAIDSATASSPVRITGLSDVASVGSVVTTCINKKEAEKMLSGQTKKPLGEKIVNIDKEITIPVVLKADTTGSIEAIVGEIRKYENDKVNVKIVGRDIGPVSERDVKLLVGSDSPFIIAFHIPTDSHAKDIAEKQGVTIVTFDIIYKLSEWLESEIKKRTPIVATHELVGRSKLLKVFTRTGDKQIVGGEVKEGMMIRGEKFRLIRKSDNIGEGKISSLESNRIKSDRVESGAKFGAMLDAKTEMREGDEIELWKPIDTTP